jgi:hypothetical protein
MILTQEKVIIRLWEPLKDNWLLSNLWEQVNFFIQKITCHNAEENN